MNDKMLTSKHTRVQSKKKKKRRFLMTSKKSWVIEDRLVPLYSNLIDCYSNQLPEDPFCCEIIQVKQESQEDFLLESLPSVDQYQSSYPLKEVIWWWIADLIDLGLHRKLWSGFLQVKFARSFLFSYLERLERSLVYLPLHSFICSLWIHLKKNTDRSSK